MIALHPHYERTKQIFLLHDAIFKEVFLLFPCFVFVLYLTHSETVSPTHRSSCFAFVAFLGGNALQARGDRFFRLNDD